MSAYRDPRSLAPRAFTLIELLVVIGIIGLLISILLPVISSARKQANAVYCMSNLRTLGQGMFIYMAEYRGVVPWEGYAEGDRPTRHLGWWEEPSTWFNAMPAYMKLKPYCAQQADEMAGRGTLPRAGDRGLFVCPDAAPAFANTSDDEVIDGYFMLWGVDKNGNPERRKTYWCYGYNTQLDGGIEDRNVNYRVTIRPSKIHSSSLTIVLVEKIMHASELNPPFSSEVGQQEVSYKEFTTRHRGGGHLLFLDGHVGYFKRTEVLRGPNTPYDYNQPGFLIWNPASSLR